MVVWCTWRRDLTQGNDRRSAHGRHTQRTAATDAAQMVDATTPTSSLSSQEAATLTRLQAVAGGGGLPQPHARIQPNECVESRLPLSRAPRRALSQTSRCHMLSEDAAGRWEHVQAPLRPPQGTRRARRLRCPARRRPRGRSPPCPRCSCSRGRKRFLFEPPRDTHGRQRVSVAAVQRQLLRQGDLISSRQRVLRLRCMGTHAQHPRRQREKSASHSDKPDTFVPSIPAWKRVSALLI